MARIGHAWDQHVENIGFSGLVVYPNIIVITYHPSLPLLLGEGSTPKDYHQALQGMCRDKARVHSSGAYYTLNPN